MYTGGVFERHQLYAGATARASETADFPLHCCIERDIFGAGLADIETFRVRTP
jgi:hypothetical protein